jgi:hypothetical protein
MRQASELLVHERSQFGERGVVPVTPSREEISDSLLRGRRRIHNVVFTAYQAQTVPARRKRLRKNLNSDDQFDRSFAPYGDEGKLQNHEKEAEKFKHH